MGNRPTDWHVLDLDDDPTPGDPERVKQLARELHDFADDVADALRQIKGMAGEDALLRWAGKTAKAFQDEFEEVPNNLKKLQRSYDLAGDALAAYWPKLERAQSLADKALAKGREAQSDLTAANGRLDSANSWVDRATKKTEEYDGKEGKEKPDESEVRAATRNATDAKSARASAQSAVDNAQGGLEAAKKMAGDAKKMREDAASEAKDKLEDASDAGIQNRKWWEKAVDWVKDNWDTIVTVCKVIVAVLGIVVLIIGGPLAWVVLAAALVVLADTLYKYMNGEASLWDVAFAALDCIPGMKGLTTLGKLAGGLKALAKGGLKGMAAALRGLGTKGLNKLRGAANGMRSGMDNLVAKGKAAVGRCPGGDPVDMVSGEMIMIETDVRLPALLALTCTRTHLSTYRYGRWFGASWASTFDQRLEIDADGAALATEDGMLLAYPVPRPGVPVLPEEGPAWPLVWDGTAGGEIRVTDPAGGLTRHFAADGAQDGGSPVVLPVRAVSDRNGQRIDFDYGPDGLPLAIRHSGGYHVDVRTDDEGNVTALALREGEDSTVLVSYGYDAEGNLTEVVNSSGEPFRYTYDEQSRITAWIDRNGSWYAFEYDDEDRCVGGSGADGFLDCTIAYDARARTTAYTDSLGHTTVHHHNELLQRTSVTDPLGHTDHWTYDERNRLRSHTDALGHTTRYDYDGAGNLTAVTSPDETSVTAEFNDIHLPLVLHGADGTRWTYTYDERGNRTSATDPHGATTTFAYDDAGTLTALTDPLGVTTRVECDPRGLPVRTVDQHGAAIERRRDAFGRVAATVDALGQVTHVTWTTEGKPVTRTHPDGTAETWHWDAEGNLVAHTGPTGATTRFEYTHFDLLAAQTGADGARRAFAYDTELRLTAVTDARGATWTYDFDAAGRLVAESDFNDRVLRYARDATGALSTRTNGAGQTTTYRRDSRGRIVEKLSGTAVTTYAYGIDGRMVRAENADAVLEVERDDAGRLLRETVNGRTTGYAYDELGRRRRRSTPSGAVSEWEYADNGLPVRLVADGHEVTFAYDGIGRETERVFGEGFRIGQRWDESHRLVGRELTAPAGSGGDDPLAKFRTVGRTAYRYDPAGRLVGLDDLHTGSRALELDAEGRITTVRAEGWSERYAYDAAGNVTSAAAGAAAGTAAAGTAAEGGAADGGTATEPEAYTYTGNRLRRAGRSRYDYDDQGRCTSITRRTLSGTRRTWRFTWDADDQLTAVVTPDGSRWRYRYDPMGRRLAKELLDADGGVARRVDFAWDGDRLAEQSTRTDDGGSHSVTWDYEPGGHRPVAQSERRSLRGAPQEEIDRRFYAIATDLVGAPTDLVTPDGEVVWRHRATVWGSPAGTAPAAPAACPLRFPGQYADEESGLHYNRHRYYDPRSTRFLTPDPLGLAAAPDDYAYAPNPLTWSDPLGLQMCPQFLRIDWLTEKLLSRVSYQYQRFVTHTDYEQVFKLKNGREVHVDGGPTADNFIVEAKWTGNEKQWSSSQYNPEHRHYNQDRIIDQAERLVALNDELGANGVRYATSSPQGADHLRELFSDSSVSQSVADALSDGRLQVFHVPANGMIST
ncbi:RHS repeat-associated core domain-containing protein [Streptomyces sp. NPDC004134]|uniref:RHS repeat-associated core domain-containing protein n=1 Tax=Streptomyces sp. NPDC004134 TaxID=3364691 RepID=UPI00367A5154